MEPLPLHDILITNRLVPYDSFAVWLHFASASRSSARRTGPL